MTIGNRTCLLNGYISFQSVADLCLDVHCKYGARCEGGRCICPTDCPDKREPVCGSDRITYNNECVMRKVSHLLLGR